MFGRGESSLSTPHPRCQQAGLAPPTDLQERDPRDTLGVSPKQTEETSSEERSLNIFDIYI